MSETTTQALAALVAVTPCVGIRPGQANVGNTWGGYFKRISLALEDAKYSGAVAEAALPYLNDVVDSGVILEHQQSQGRVVGPRPIFENIRTCAEWIAAYGSPDDSAEEFGHNEHVIVILATDETLNPDGIRDSLQRSTWLGCRAMPAPYDDVTLPVKVGARRVVAGQRRAQGSMLVQGSDGTFFNVDTSGTGNRVDVDFRRFSCRAGVEQKAIRARVVARALGVPSEALYGGTRKLRLGWRVDVFKGSGGEPDFLEALRAYGKTNRNLRQIVEERLEVERRETARVMRNWMQDVRERREVWYKKPDGGRVWLGKEPENEHETILLIARGERSLQEIIHPNFRLLSHASSEGVDCVAELGDGPTAPSQYHFAEIEFKLDSFFTHQHPIEHVDYIICWTRGRVGEGIWKYFNDELSVEVRRVNWGLRLDFPSGKRIQVLPLADAPGIEVD